jgi:hypothetical protein
MAAGGHLHLYDDYYVSRIKGNLNPQPLPLLEAWSHWWSQSQAWKWGGLHQEGHPA